jgi:exodeoxyribonuclease VII large subunit
MARLWMSWAAPVLRLPMSELANSPLPRLVWGVGALLLAAGDALQMRFGAITVKGEVSGLARAASGHCYFALKDIDGAAALLRCAMFRRAAMLVNFAVLDGQQVELRGRFAVYEPRGELQFVVESMQRIGAGALYEEFLRLKARLDAAGLFDAARKRRIAPWPAAVGIVTSTAAAALRDVLATLARRAPQLRVVIYPSPVQGAEAAASLAAALRLAASRREVDTLLLVRGGGSLEDLWCFNDERLVRAIVESPLPVISGVGHEGDVTLADLAADLRAATPTAAAELAAPAQADALAQLDELERALQRRLRQVADTHAQRLDALALRLGGPARALQLQRQALASIEARGRRALRQAAVGAALEQQQLGTRLRNGMRQQLDRQRYQLQASVERLDALDPRRVLARGFAWVTDAAGLPVMSIRAVLPDAMLQAVWSDGSARVKVLELQRKVPPG